MSTNKNNPLIFIICFTIIIFLYHCTSIPEEMETADTAKYTFIQDNCLIQHKISLVLPEGWLFKSTTPEDKEGVLFHFTNVENDLLGSYEFVQFDFTISLEKTTHYYMDSILAGFKKNKFNTLEIGGLPASVIYADHITEPLSIIIVLIQNMNDLHIIEVLGDIEYLKANKKITDEILSSFKLIHSTKSMRINQENLRFYCYDGSWIWLDDMAGGFLLGGKIKDSDSVVGVWEIQEEDIQLLNEKKQDFTISDFPSYFYINNQKISSMGCGDTKEDGYIKLYYLLEYRNKQCCIFISVPKTLDIVPQEIHLNESVKSLFSNNLFFEIK